MFVSRSWNKSNSLLNHFISHNLPSVISPKWKPVITKFALKRHKEVVHEGIELVKCVLCKYTCTRKENIVRHLQKGALGHKTGTPNRKSKNFEDLSIRQQKRVSQKMSIGDLLKENNNCNYFMSLGLTIITSQSKITNIFNRLYYYINCLVIKTLHQIKCWSHIYVVVKNDFIINIP